MLSWKQKVEHQLLSFTCFAQFACINSLGNHSLLHMEMQEMQVVIEAGRFSNSNGRLKQTWSDLKPFSRNLQTTNHLSQKQSTNTKKDIWHKCFKPFVGLETIRISTSRTRADFSPDRKTQCVSALFLLRQVCKKPTRLEMTVKMQTNARVPLCLFHYIFFLIIWNWGISVEAEKQHIFDV